MISLLMIVSSPVIGGGEKYLGSLCKGLVDRGHKVIVACSENLIGFFRENGAITCKLHIGPKLNKRNYWQLIFTPFLLVYLGYMIWKINRNDGLDIIHVQYKKEQIIATIVAKLFGIKVVWTEHGPLHSLIVKNPILLWVYRFCALLADKIIVVSEATKISLQKIGIPIDKLVRIYNGVIFPPIQVLHSHRTSQKIVTVIARLIPDKGHLYLFRSFKIVKQKIPEAHLLVIGDGPLRRQLEELVKDLGLADSVSFLGHISHDHVQELLGKTEVVVMPSIGEGEGLPYAVLEAMSHAKPVVATSVGGLPELVIDGETGIIVSPLDCVQLAEAIITLMQNPTLAHEMGKKGRKRVESEFSYNAMIDQTERLLLDVLNK